MKLKKTLVLIPGSLVAGSLFAVGPASAQVPSCFGRPATIVGGNGNNDLQGTPGDDVIVGRGGADRIEGRGGDDRICGGPGVTSLKATAGTT